MKNFVIDKNWQIKLPIVVLVFTLLFISGYFICLFYSTSIANISSCAPLDTQLTHNNTSKPLIAYMMGVTSRSEHATGHTATFESVMQNQAVMQYALPSFVNTASDGFQYLVVLGYDQGDKFYDNELNWLLLEDWFETNAARPLMLRNIKCKLKGVRVNNPMQKPGPVFNEVARVAYNMGAEYFYRVNDDTELISPWAREFVETLTSFGPPFGVVGPQHVGGNLNILTHDFVHRTHMDIFNQNYYPKQLTDWWLDDWISYVYGPTRTKKLCNVITVHHTREVHTRYKVDWKNKEIWKSILKTSQEHLANWTKYKAVHV